MKSDFEKTMSDYVYDKILSNKEYLQRSDNDDMANFLRKDKFKSQNYDAVEAVRLSAMSSLASVSALNNFQQCRNETAILASERQTARTVAKLADVEAKITQSNAYLKSIDQTLLGIEDRVTETNSILNESKEVLEEQTKVLNNIDHSLHDLSVTFNWFSASVVTSLGSIGQSLEQIIKSLENPSKTWAAEQFVDARNFYDKKLIRESFDCLDKSLNGYGSYTGNSYDHRALFLKGLIHLGTHERKDNDLVDGGFKLLANN